MIWTPKRSLPNFGGNSRMEVVTVEKHDGRANAESGHSHCRSSNNPKTQSFPPAILLRDQLTTLPTKLVFKYGTD
jgi:hypothetical protein